MLPILRLAPAMVSWLLSVPSGLGAAAVRIHAPTVSGASSSMGMVRSRSRRNMVSVPLGSLVTALLDSLRNRMWHQPHLGLQGRNSRHLQRPHQRHLQWGLIQPHSLNL